MSTDETTNHEQYPPQNPLEEITVYFIDVGQGDSILIDYGESELLIDGDDRSPGITDYLRSIVDGEIEVMVATHPHADHIGGLIEVLKQYEVSEIWYDGDGSTSKTYADFILGVQGEGADVHIAQTGDIINFNGLSVTVMNSASSAKDTITIVSSFYFPLEILISFSWVMRRKKRNLR